LDTRLASASLLPSRVGRVEPVLNGFRVTTVSSRRRFPMKAVILAGGLGTRISEETHLKPKPMIEIGGRPILWHVMKLFFAHGVNDFVICCRYKGYLIKETSPTTFSTCRTSPSTSPSTR
jgi:hypothetical protein